YADITFSGAGIEPLTLRNIPSGADLGDIVLNQDPGIVQGYLQRISDTDAFIRNVLRHANLRNNNLAAPEHLRTTAEITAVDRSNDLGGFVTVLFDTTTTDAVIGVYANVTNNPTTASVVRAVPRDSLLRIGNRSAVDVPAGAASQYYWVQYANSLHGPNVAVPVDNSTPLRADLNGNGQIDILDIAIIAQIFATSAEYDPAADLNNDGEINVLDIAEIATVFGRSVVRDPNEGYIIGVVRDSGTGNRVIPGAVTQFGSAIDTTDTQGRYLLRLGQGSAHALTITHPNYQTWQSAVFPAGNTVLDARLSQLPQNTAPHYAGGLRDTTITAGDTLRIGLQRFFSDAETAADALQYGASTDKLLVNGATAVWMPTQADTLRNVRFTATDAGGLSAESDPIQLAAARRNTAPQYLGGLADRVVMAGDTMRWDLTQFFADAETAKELLRYAVNTSRIALNGATALWMPTKPDTLKDVRFTATDAENLSVLSPLIQLRSTGINTAAIAAQSYFEDSTATFSVQNSFVPVGVAVERYEAAGFTNIAVTVNPQGSVTVRSKTRDFTGTETGVLRAYYGSKHVELPLEIRIMPLSDVRATLMSIVGIAGAPEQRTAGIVEAAGQQYATAGTIDLQLPPGTHNLRVYGTANGARNTYVNSIFTLANGEDFRMDTVRVCTLPDTGWGMDTSQYKALIREGATVGGYLKPFDYSQMRYLFLRKHPSYPAFTDAELNFIINDILKQRIFARTGLSYPIQILEQNDPIPLPGKRYGVVLVVKADRFTYGTNDYTGDGIRDEGSVTLGDIDEFNADPIMAELCGPFMPEEVNTNFPSIFYRTSFYSQLQRGDMPIFPFMLSIARIMQTGYGGVHVDKALGVN
ncbi:hypothetical protein HY491_00595, partial [Candidatus Woesearchaeota archaeon]|nr:hypothetical protein [Candidatus Woesearchaeota archaeon]